MTYNQYYFDIQYQPEIYSSATAANRAGYATLAIDRLGAGASLRPPSAFGPVTRSRRQTAGRWEEVPVGAGHPILTGGSVWRCSC